MKTKKIFQKNIIVFILAAMMLLATGFVKNSAATVQAQGWYHYQQWIGDALNSMIYNVDVYCSPQFSTVSPGWTFDVSLAANSIGGRMNTLITYANWSMESTNPGGIQPRGLMASGDVIVCTPSMILWFDKTSDGSATTNGGGGMLRGIWPIYYDGSSYQFERVVNANYYSPNYLYTGSVPGAKGSGISLLANYGKNQDNGFALAIEHEDIVSMGATGATVNEAGQPYDGGVFVQFSGQLKNSPRTYPYNYVEDGISINIADIYDCDPSTSVGRTSYVLTYRVHPRERKFRQDISLTVTQNNLGPLGTMTVSTNMPGYDGKGSDGAWRWVYFGSDTDWGGTGTMPLTLYSTTFYNAPNMKFYELAPNVHNAVQWKETSMGTGGLISMGNPGNALAPVRFLEIKPDIGIMQAMYPSGNLNNTYFLQAIDNQGAVPGSRVFDLAWVVCEYNRLGGDVAKRTFPEGTNIYLISDYTLREVYTVSKTAGSGTTINAPSANVTNSGVANRLEAFTFTVVVDAAHSQSVPTTATVSIGGGAAQNVPLTPMGGNTYSYTIPAASVTGNIQITTANLPLNTYTVSKTQGTGTTITAATTATHGTDFTFTAAPLAGYNATGFTVTVTVNGIAVTPTKSGDTYTIAAGNVTGPIVISTSNLMPEIQSGDYYTPNDPGSGRFFPNLKAACDAINEATTLGTINGNIRLIVNGSLNPAENMGIVNETNYSITITSSDSAFPQTISFQGQRDNGGPDGVFAIGCKTNAGGTLEWSNVGVAKNITIENLDIETQSTAVAANIPILILNESSNITIDNCTIKNLSGGIDPTPAVYIRGADNVFIPAGYNNKMPQNVTIQNSSIANKGGVKSMAIAIDRDNHTGVSIAAGIKILNNSIEGNNGGISTNYAAIEISKNEIRVIQTSSGQNSAGIFGGSSSARVEIIKNKFIKLESKNNNSGFGIDAIHVEGGGPWYIENNYITGFNKNDTDYSGYSISRIRGLSLDDPDGKGIFVRHNTFYMCPLSNASAHSTEPDDTDDDTYCAIVLKPSTLVAEIKNNLFVSNYEDSPNFFFLGIVPGASPSFGTGTYISGTDSYYVPKVTDNNVFYISGPNTFGFAKVIPGASPLSLKYAAQPVEFEDASKGNLALTGASLGDPSLIVFTLEDVLTSINDEDRNQNFYKGDTSQPVTFAGAYDNSAKVGDITTHISFLTAGGIRVICLGNQITVISDNKIQSVKLFDTQGRLLISDQDATSVCSFTAPGKGIYIIELETANSRNIQKVAVGF